MAINYSFSLQNTLNLSAAELHFFSGITHCSALYSGFSETARDDC